MKNLILLSAVCMIGTVSGQNTDYQTIDYLNDKSTVAITKVKIGSRYGLKITNVNKKILNINNKIVQNNFNETVPPLFEIFTKSKLPPEGETPAALSSTSTNFLYAAEASQFKLPDPINSQLVTLLQLYKDTRDEISENNARIDMFIGYYKDYKNILNFQSNLLTLQSNCDQTFEKILSEVNKQSVISFPTGTTENDSAPQDSYMSNRSIISSQINQLQSDSDNLYYSLLQKFSKSNIDYLSKKALKIKKSIIEIIPSIEALKKTENKDLLTNLKLERDEEGISSMISKSVDYYNYINIPKLYNNIENFNNTGKKDFFATYDYFTINNWTYFLDPQSIDKDLTILTVTITPKEILSCSPVPKTYEVRIKAKSGLKIDFSTGLFVNFGGNNFRDQTYSYENIEGNSTQQKIIRNEPKSIIFPSIGALMHVYNRTGNDFNFGGTFGLSTKDFEKINYHLGVSFIFGTSQRFILSSGLTLTKATLISDEYFEGQIINKDGAPETIPTSSFYRVGFFTSLTFNLTAK